MTSTNTEEREKLLEECKTVEEDSLYTAQAHFEIATTGWVSASRVLLLVIPAIIAAGANINVLWDGPKWVSSIGIAAGLIAAVASYLGVDKRKEEHEQAGKDFTLLRHKARRLHKVFQLPLSIEELRYEVRNICENYSALAKNTPLTNSKAFDKARKRIKDGIFVPDFKENEEKN